MDQLHPRSGQLPEQMSFDQVCNAQAFFAQGFDACCRGWDDLFNKCSENLNSLTAMKLSPYYKGEYAVVLLQSRFCLTVWNSLRGRGNAHWFRKGVEAWLTRV